MSDTPSHDPLRKWLTRGSLAAGIAFTAHAEYELARALGANPAIAAMLPVAIDAYVVAAMRWFRVFDTVLSLALMGAAQIAAHLLDAGVMTVNIPMVIVVSLLVPVAIWRTHALARSDHKPAPVSAAQSPAVSVDRALAPSVSAPPANVERPALTPPPALAERPTVSATAKRAVSAPAERERPAKPKTERAKPTPKAAQTSEVERRRDRVKHLYAEYGRRPEWTEIRDALVADKLAPADISRPTVQRDRDAVEKNNPHLAALGTDNVRPLPKTGS